MSAAYADDLPGHLDLVHLGIAADGHTASLIPVIRSGGRRSPGPGQRRPSSASRSADRPTSSSPDSAPAALVPASRLVTAGSKTRNFRDSTGALPPSSRRRSAVGRAAVSLVAALGTVFVLVLLFLFEAPKLETAQAAKMSPHQAAPVAIPAAGCPADRGT